MNRGEVQFESIVSFILEKCGPLRLRMTRETRLFEDIGIDGDDAVELISAYSQVFQVDMSCFNLQMYVGNEGIDVIGAILSVFNPTLSNPIKSLTLGMLEDAARLGYWPKE